LSGKSRNNRLVAGHAGLASNAITSVPDFINRIEIVSEALRPQRSA
jgi:hypothetical protein